MRAREWWSSLARSAENHNGVVKAAGVFMRGDQGGRVKSQRCDSQRSALERSNHAGSCCGSSSAPRWTLMPPTPTTAHRLARPPTPLQRYSRVSDILVTMSLTYSVKDRTAEFRSCVESIRNRSAAPQAKQRVPNGQAVGGSKGEFARRAQAIGKDISATTVKLGKLAQCK